MKHVTKLVCMGLLAGSLVGCSSVNNFMNEFVLKKDSSKTEEKETKKEDTKEDNTVSTENKKEETTTPVTASDETVYEMDVMNLLNNQAVYNGKMVRVKGFIPEGKITDNNNVEMYGLVADDGLNFIQLKGIDPTVSNCQAWVTGKASVEGSEVVITAISYELIEQKEEAVVEETVLVEETTTQPVQQTTPAANQQYYYVIVDGKRVFETEEGQRIWDARQQQESQNNTSVDTEE